tara:strand:+ start:4969 stop:5520 length:552 start_codon:yes stop_codon:yes gene_type:complete
MQSEWVSIEKITPWERNPRMNEHIIQQVAVSIQQFGFLNPIIAQTSTSKIIAGHSRYKAAKKLGLATIPVIWADLSDDKAKAYAIADNKLGELASWDEDLLIELLRELQDTEININELGFDELELSHLFNDNSYSDLNTDHINEDEIEYSNKVMLRIEINAGDEVEIKALLRDLLSNFDHVWR